MTNPLAKRTFDFVMATIGLVVLAPVMAGIALLVLYREGPPLFFRQLRVGRNGRPFWIWKFRTMIPAAERHGLGVTSAGDARVTPTGAWLRKTKLDELPQLWNVWLGEMSFVGPRPELPSYVARYTPEQRAVLRLKPGITDLATLEFREEEQLLAAAEDVESFYVEHCVPRKIELNLAYAQRASFWSDLGMILRTLWPAAQSAQRRRGGTARPAAQFNGRK